MIQCWFCFFLDCKRPIIRVWKLKTMLDQLQVLQILTPVFTMIVITGCHKASSTLNSGKLLPFLHCTGVSWWKAPCPKCTKKIGFPGLAFWKKSLRCADMCHYSPLMPKTRWQVLFLASHCATEVLRWKHPLMMPDGRLYVQYPNECIVMTSFGRIENTDPVVSRLLLQVEHQTRRRYMAEHALATARTEIGDCKGRCTRCIAFKCI